MELMQKEVTGTHNIKIKSAKLIKILGTLNNSISTISNKIMKEIQFKINNQDNVSVEELEEKLKYKVSTAEFMDALDLKSNSSDTATAMKSIGKLRGLIY